MNKRVESVILVIVSNPGEKLILILSHVTEKPVDLLFKQMR